MERAGQFALRQGGVDLFVTNHMQQNRGTALAPFEFWDQMVQAAAPIRDGAVTEWADRIALWHGRYKLALDGVKGKGT
ncbi:hypothetical protein RUE5091_03462 [Ruegeria denitrificans]|uniref:Uncharacterized protein n=1 Tax=Ruegeria denitrificans TaxID=1715692 RepID=A0A0P1IGM6_9RHOB|nr:hypothetical protein RUE5091_03462 [Ruegeria denitrificans]